jgi:hypothetical protein
MLRPRTNFEAYYYVMIVVAKDDACCQGRLLPRNVANGHTTCLTVNGARFERRRQGQDNKMAPKKVVKKVI